MDIGINAPCLTLAFDPVTSIVYGGTPGSVIRSTDGGLTWLWASNGIPSGAVWVVTIDPKTPATVYAGTQNGGGMFKTSNRAGLWKAASSGLTAAKIFSLAVDPAAPSTIYAGGDPGVFKSVDGGKSWTLVAGNLPDNSVWALAVVPGSSAILAGTDGGGFRSTDGGATWSQGFPPFIIPYAFAIDPNSPSTVYAAGCASSAQPYGAAGRSTDGGSTWSVFGFPPKGQPNPPVINTAAVVPSPALPLILGTDGGGIWGTSVRSGGGVDLVTNGGLARPGAFLQSSWIRLPDRTCTPAPTPDSSDRPTAASTGRR